MDEQKASPSQRILLVGDVLQEDRELCEGLHAMGHGIYGAIGSRRAIELTCDVNPDCIVLELFGKRSEGLQIARRVRQLQLARQPLLVAATGPHQTYERLHAEEAGIDVCLVMPMELPVLRALLQADSLLTGSTSDGRAFAGGEDMSRHGAPRCRAA
jgi:CheY-like chemotaxis protein